MGTIGLVLLMACVNVANLMLVRAESRHKELSMRAALGAGRSRIARQLLTESVVLGAAGALLGVGVAYLCLRVLLPIAPGSLPRMDEIAIDVPVLLFAIVLSLASALLFGAITLGRYARPQRMAALRLSPGSSGLSREGRTRNVLVVVQVALALVLLIAAALMIRTFGQLRAVDPGFSGAHDLQTAQITVPFTSSPDPATVARRHHDILDRIAAVPGVTSVAFTNAVPLGAPFQMTELLFPEGKAFGPGNSPKARDFRFISPGFFSTMGISLVTGRDLTWTDVHERRPVVLVSENLARSEWGSPAKAIGRRLRGASANDAWREIVGVVANVHDRGLTEPAPEAVYVPFLADRLYDNPTYVWPAQTYVIRSPRTGTSGFLEDVSRAVWSVDPSLPLANVRAMDEIVSASVARTSFTLVMLVLAGTMALVLGAVGVYGVIAYAVAQRTHEFGIRLALGAKPGMLKLMVLRRGFLHASIGIALGLGAVMALTRVMSSLLFGVGPRDPITFVGVPMLLLMVIVAASYFPARRAAAVNPVDALRAE
jgi:predicted permease